MLTSDNIFDKLKHTIKQRINIMAKKKNINKVDLGIQITAWLAEFIALTLGGIVLLTQFEQWYIVATGIFLLAKASLMFIDKVIKGTK